MPSLNVPGQNLNQNRSNNALLSTLATVTGWRNQYLRTAYVVTSLAATTAAAWNGKNQEELRRMEIVHASGRTEGVVQDPVTGGLIQVADYLDTH